MKRLGIFGGTFDPIHYGHLRLAEEVRKQLNLEKILFIPSYLPPHKLAMKVTDADQRAEMVALAIKGHPCFEPSRIEMRRKGISYTFETLAELKKIHPQTELYVMMGVDQLLEIETWKNPHSIFRLSKVVVMNRPGTAENGFGEIRNLFSKMGIRDWESKMIWMEVTPTDISSTMIRERVAKGKSISGLVPKAVEEYILNKGLYKGSSYQ